MAANDVDSFLKLGHRSRRLRLGAGQQGTCNEKHFFTCKLAQYAYAECVGRLRITLATCAVQALVPYATGVWA